MFCSNCGEKIVGSGKFCAACGAPAVNAASCTYSPPPEPARAYMPYASAPARVEQKLERSWVEVFREGWRSFFRSPLVLATIICYTVVQALSLISMNSAMGAVGAVIDSAGMYGSKLSGNETGLTAISFIALVPGIMIVIGMWVIYADTKSDSSEHINTAGLSIIKGTYIANIAAMLLLMIVALSLIGKAEAAMGKYGAGAFASTKAILVVIVLASCGYLAFVVYAITKMKKTAEDCSPEGTGAAMGMGIVSIIGGVLSALGVLAVGFTLSGIASSAAAIMLGVVLCQYKTKMDELSYAQLPYMGKSNRFGAANANPTARASRPVQTTGEYVPAWKRVQMANNPSAQVVQQPEKPAVTAKKCPECGTVQSGDNRVCFYCGADM